VDAVFAVQEIVGIILTMEPPPKKNLALPDDISGFGQLVLFIHKSLRKKPQVKEVKQ